MAKTKEEDHSLKNSIVHFWELVKPYKMIFFLLLFVVLVIESTTVVEKYFFKMLIDSGTTYSAGTTSKTIFLKILFFVAAGYAIIVVFRSVLKWLHIGLINILDANIIADIKRKFFDHIVHLSHSFHTTHKTGSLISRLTRGSRAIESMMDAIVFNFAPMLFQLIVATVAIVTLSMYTALSIALTVSVFIIFSIYVQSKQYTSRVKANDTEDMEKGNIGDIFTNIDSIKYFGKEKQIKGKFRELTENTKRDFLDMWEYYRTLDTGHSVIIGIGTFAVMYFPMSAFLDGTMTLGTIVFIYTVFLGLLGPMYRFVQGMRGFYQASADFESLYQYDEIKNDIIDEPDAQELHLEKGTIEFKNVTFKYNNRTILNNFNLKIASNEKIAVVGHSGSGKSTMIKLLYRFYDLDKGNIYVEGNDIKTYQQESLRSSMSIVPQECILFDDTIYNNILFSRPDATHDEVFAAIKFAQLDTIIAQFPKKENTIVGERGVRLSGGEKQRVNIARALLANKKILVLDEATSALDSKTEHEIQNDFKRLMKGKTTIIIAHRLSTIMHADRIIVLEKGKIVQQGTHAQLIKKRGQYKQLWTLQKGGYVEEDEL